MESADRLGSTRRLRSLPSSSHPPPWTSQISPRVGVLTISSPPWRLLFRPFLESFSQCPPGPLHEVIWLPKSSPNGTHFDVEFASFLKMRKPRLWRPLTQFERVQGISFERMLHMFSTLFHMPVLRSPLDHFLKIFGFIWAPKLASKLT